MKATFCFEYIKRIKILSTILAGLVVALFYSGCTDSNDISEVTPGGDAASNGDASIEMDSGVDAKLDAEMNRDADSNRDARVISCCGYLCTEGIGLYDDAGVNEYIKDRFRSSESAISRLYRFCSNKYVNCEEYKFDIRWPFFPPANWQEEENNGVHVLDLVDIDGILFIWPPEEKLSDHLEAAAMGSTGWKIEITGASIVYETTQCPPATIRGPGIDLEGSLDNVKFARDVTDTLSDYVVLKDSNGKVVLDTRDDRDE
jgi:hypothetical protein